MANIIHCPKCRREIRFSGEVYSILDTPLFRDENGNLMCEACYSRTRKPTKEEIKKIIKEMKADREI